MATFASEYPLCQAVIYFGYVDRSRWAVQMRRILRETDISTIYTRRVSLIELKSKYYFKWSSVSRLLSDLRNLCVSGSACNDAYRGIWSSQVDFATQIQKDSAGQTPLKIGLLSQTQPIVCLLRNRTSYCRKIG